MNITKQELKELNEKGKVEIKMKLGYTEWYEYLRVIK